MQMTLRMFCNTAKSLVETVEYFLDVNTLHSTRNCLVIVLPHTVNTCDTCGDLLWVLHRDLQDQLWRNVKDLRVFSIGLQHQWQHIKATIFWGPPQPNTKLWRSNIFWHYWTPNKAFCQRGRAQLTMCALTLVYLQSNLFLESYCSSTCMCKFTSVNSTLEGSPRVVPSGIW